MKLRTYFWNDRVVSQPVYYINSFLRKSIIYFKNGNAGDILNIDLMTLLEFNYSSYNIKLHFL